MWIAVRLLANGIPGKEAEGKNKMQFKSMIRVVMHFTQKFDTAVL